MATDHLTVEQLRDRFSYDLDTGIFRRKKNSGGPWKAGTIAGTKDDFGYSRIYISGKLYRAHRLAWLYVNGEWPKIIDHINGNRCDNRLCNLREVTCMVNAQNIREPHPNNVSGMLGVSHTRTGKFTATIRVMLAGHCLQLYLGSYPTSEDAQSVYLAAKRLLHDGCAI